jgi:capsular polysaccharide biosynthesis protein
MKTFNFHLTIAKSRCKMRRFFRLLMQKMGIAVTPPICENLLLWGPAFDFESKKIHDPFLMDYPLPECITSHPALHKMFQLVDGLGFHSQHLVKIPNALVRGHRGMISFGGNNNYIAEAHWRVSNVYGHPIYLNEWPICETRELEGDWYCMMGRNGSQYFHWIWDELPRLYSALPHLPPGTRFLVAAEICDFQKDSLKALGITPELCLLQDFHVESRVERLWFPTPPGHSEQAAVSPYIAKGLRKALVGKLGSHNDKANRRVFISRAGARRRKLTNEKELTDHIETLGFEIVQAENLSFAQQVELFSRCSIVLAQHGAGLTNILFAPDHCKVLEIHGPEVSRVHYWMMTRALGLNYDCFVGSKVSYSADDGEPDFEVEMPAFKKWLEQAITDEK